MPAQEPQTYGSLIGREISAARGRLQLSQTSVAVRMRSLGFDWHQQTVASVEKGKRRVTAEELLFLSYALQTTVAALERPADDGLVISVPSGGYIAVASVQRSVAGVRDDAIQWKGNDPVFAEALVEQLVAMGIPSHSRTDGSQVETQDRETGQWAKREDEGDDAR
jgi:transcriptional regulator with XRE-family HTH domain